MVTRDLILQQNPSISSALRRAQGMQQAGASTAPAYSIGEAFARALTGGLGGMEERAANRELESRQNAAQTALQKAIQVGQGGVDPNTGINFNPNPAMISQILSSNPDTAGMGAQFGIHQIQNQQKSAAQEQARQAAAQERRDFERFKVSDPQILAGKRAIAEAGRTQINNNVNTGNAQADFRGADDFFKERAKQTAKDIGTQISEIPELQRQIVSNDAAMRVLERNPNITVGKGSETLNTFKQILGQTGVLPEDVLQNVSDFNVLQSRIEDNTLNKTQILKGAITERESERAQAAAGSLQMTREGLIKTLRLNTRLNEIEIDRRSRADEYARTIGQGSLAGFNQWYQSLEGRPRIDESVLGGSVSQLAPEDEALLEFMTPEERTLFNGAD